MAAASAAGVVALLLQGNPTMTPASAVTEITQRAVSDAYTAAVPNDRWGWGKLRGVAQTTGVGEPVAARAGFAMRSANPARGAASFVFSLAAEDIAPGRPVGIDILDVNGRRVATLRGEQAAGPQQLTWDGRGAGGERAVPGVYWARLQIGSRSGALKFVHL